MFGSQKAYGANSNTNNHTNQHNYGNTSYYSSTSPSNDSFWGNRSGNRLNYSNAVARDSAPINPAIANDSLYGYNSLDKNSEQIDTNKVSDYSGKNEKYGNLASIVSASSGKKTTWATIASQPAKSQPKSLKAKMTAGLTGTTKHLPVISDVMSWDSKNGSLSNVSSGTGKSIGHSTPAAAVIPNSQSLVPQPMPSTIVHTDTISSELYISDMMDPTPAQAARENSWNNNGNSSPAGSITANSDRQTPTNQPKQSNNYKNEHLNGAHSQPINKYNNQQRVEYSSNRMENQSYDMKNSVHHPQPPVRRPPAARDLIDDDEDDEDIVANDNENDLSEAILKLCVENNYNPKEFDLNLKNARFFIIKSYSEDDIHRSIKYSIWCSTEHGNKRLDNAFRQQEGKGPIYLFFSVNRSGHFCGVAEMISHVDYNASSSVWSQDKWKGQFKVRWIYVKDVPNDELRHITLENNENKPVTNSRDTQEVPYEKGKLVINIIHRFQHQTSIFDDFQHYEQKQVEELTHRKQDTSPPPTHPLPPSQHVNNYYNKMQSNNSHHYSHHGAMAPPPPPPTMRPEPNSMIYRSNHNYNNKPRSYNDRDAYRGGNDVRHENYRNEYPQQPQRNNFRNNYGDSRPHRNDYGHQYNRNMGEQYYNNNQDRGYNRDRDYYVQPPRDYPPPANDYRGAGGGGGGDYPRDHSSRNHDRMQSWRN